MLYIFNAPIGDFLGMLLAILISFSLIVFLVGTAFAIFQIAAAHTMQAQAITELADALSRIVDAVEKKED